MKVDSKTVSRCTSVHTLTTDHSNNQVGVVTGVEHGTL